MPDPTFKIDSVPVMSKSGTDISIASGVINNAGVASGTIGSGVETSGWEVDYLVLAGGGSGGHAAGGAGGYRLGSSTLTGEKSGGDTDLESPIYVFRGQVYKVQVGRGNPCWVTNTHTATGGGSWYGSGSMSPAYGGAWPTPAVENSVFGPITSVVGGSGTVEDYTHPGGPGGSGGGSGSLALAGEGIPGQGFKGDRASANVGGSKGGGGGAGGVASGITGGIGLESSITGTAVKRAGGGGGGKSPSPYGHGYGGNGDWGGGRSDSAHGSGGYHPATNKGGGGGGGYVQNGNAGGDGIVILSYPDTYPDLQKIHESHVCNGQAAGTTTAPSPTTSRSGFKCYEFTAGSGGISW
jgi:hypothetical protein